MKTLDDRIHFIYFMVSPIRLFLLVNLIWNYWKKFGKDITNLKSFNEMSLYDKYLIKSKINKKLEGSSSCFNLKNRCKNCGGNLFWKLILKLFHPFYLFNTL